MSDFSPPIDIKERGKVSFGTDSGFLAEFEIKPKLLEAASEGQAYPIYEDRVYTRLVSPGNTKTTWYYETKGLEYKRDEEGKIIGFEIVQLPGGEPADAHRFPQAWARFTAKGQKVSSGWAIENWGAVTRSFAETLKAMNIHTVEALAALTDSNCQSFMGGNKWRDRAKAALSEAETLSLATREEERANKAEEENRQLREDLKALKAQVAALAEKKHKAA